MGVELVKSAMVHGSSLSGNAFKVLVAMAMQALDRPKDGRPANLYFGGWEALQVALGYEVGGVTSAGHTAVKRALRELRNGGQVTPLVTASRGHRQSYLIHPGGIGQPVDNSQGQPVDNERKRVTTDPKRGSDLTLNEGQNRPLKGVTTDPPRKEEGLEGGLTGGPTTYPHTSGTDRATHRREANEESVEVGPHKHEGSPAADCLACGKGYANRTAHPLYLIRDVGT